MAELKKAIIRIIAGSRKGEQIPVLFYPSEYTMKKTNAFATTKIFGQTPAVQFTGRELETLDMDLFFDTYEKNEDVRDYTKKITDLLSVDPNLHAPPVLKFTWGNLNFTCLLISVTKKFTMFRHDGIPVRATITVSFQEYPVNEGSSSKRHSSDRTKVYTVQEGDSLWSIAASAYGDPAIWRPIAEKNNIENPRMLEIGRNIAIPPLED